MVVVVVVVVVVVIVVCVGLFSHRTQVKRPGVYFKKTYKEKNNKIGKRMEKKGTRENGRQRRKRINVLTDGKTTHKYYTDV